MFIDLHVKYPLFLSDFNDLEFSPYFFEKSSVINFHENLSSGNGGVPCRPRNGRAEGQTRHDKALFALLRTRLTMCARQQHERFTPISKLLPTVSPVPYHTYA